MTKLLNDPDIIEAKVWELQEILSAKGWKYLDRGRHRLAYLSPRGDRVVKIAHCPAGIVANKEEYEISRDPALVALHFPRCNGLVVAKVFGLGIHLGLSVLCMEYVEFKNMKITDYPRWAAMIENYQVGVNKDGKVVAYDFSRSAC